MSIINRSKLLTALESAKKTTASESLQKLLIALGEEITRSEESDIWELTRTKREFIIYCNSDDFYSHILLKLRATPEQLLLLLTLIQKETPDDSDTYRAFSGLIETLFPASKAAAAGGSASAATGGSASAAAGGSASAAAGGSSAAKEESPTTKVERILGGITLAEIKAILVECKGKGINLVTVDITTFDLTAEEDGAATAASARDKAISIETLKVINSIKEILADPVKHAALSTALDELIKLRTPPPSDRGTAKGARSIKPRGFFASHRRARTTVVRFEIDDPVYLLLSLLAKAEVAETSASTAMKGPRT